jgi:NCS1 family nucleobase:cation symporter-1
MTDAPRTTVVEHHSFDHIPADERTGTIGGQVRFWFMVNATLLTAFTGAIGPSLGLGLPATLVAILAGSVFGTLFQAFHGAQGPHLGLPQMIQSRVQFGSRGAIVPIAVAAIIPIGFAVFYLQSGASAAVTLVGGAPAPVTVAIGVTAVLLCIVGHRLIVAAESFLAWVMLANLVLLTVAAVAVLPIGALLADGAVTPAGFLAQFGAAAGYQLAIAPMVSDFTRYLPATVRGSRVSGAVFFGTMASAVWIEALGAGVAVAYPDADVIAGLRRVGDELGWGLGSATMIVSIVVFLVTAAVGMYSGSISFLSALEAFRPLAPTARLRTVTVGVAGVLVLGAALVLPDDILSSFSVFLTFLGYLLIPWTAVNLTDYYVVRRGAYSISDILRADGGIYGTWGTRGLTAYAVGLLAMVPFFSSPIYTGPAARALDADVAFLVGLIVASGAYLLLARTLDLGAERARLRHAPVTSRALGDTASP